MVREPAEAVRKIELDRLDALQRSLWPAALKGDLRDLPAVDRVLAVMGRRARLLGLDAPATIVGAQSGSVINFNIEAAEPPENGAQRTEGPQTITVTTCDNKYLGNAIPDGQ